MFYSHPVMCMAMILAEKNLEKYKSHEALLCCHLWMFPKYCFGLLVGY